MNTYTITIKSNNTSNCYVALFASKTEAQLDAIDRLLEMNKYELAVDNKITVSAFKKGDINER